MGYFEDTEIAHIHYAYSSFMLLVKEKTFHFSRIWTMHMLSCGRGCVFSMFEVKPTLTSPMLRKPGRGWRGCRHHVDEIRTSMQVPGHAFTDLKAIAGQD
jgi:hypothetical protein